MLNKRQIKSLLGVDGKSLIGFDGLIAMLIIAALFYTIHIVKVVTLYEFAGILLFPWLFLTLWLFYIDPNLKKKLNEMEEK